MSAFYRALLRLYPASFRAAYGEELCAVFEQSVARSSRVAASIAAIRDVVPNAIAAHLDILRQDLRYAFRTLRRMPGFALTAIAIVALGIGANTAAFSLADFVLLRPLPYPGSDRLIKIWTSSGPYSQTEVAPPNYRDWKSMSTSFSGMSAYVSGAANLVGIGTPRRVATALVMPDLFSLIGVAPLIGTAITPANGTAGGVAVLSHDLWAGQYASDPSVIGQVIRLDGTPHTIAGVMPPSFRFPSRSVELWVPLIVTGDDAEDRSNNYFEVVGRLKPGVTLEAARAELDAIAARLEKQYPENKDQGIFAHRLREGIGGRSRLLVIALCGASLCLLLLTCANLGSLLLARAANRARELSIRAALGAGRERLVRQMMTEAVVLVVVGGAAGIFLAWTALPLLAQLVPPTLPMQQLPTIDIRVLAFAAILIGITALGFGVVPAMRAQIVRGRQRVRTALVVVEVVGSVVLLISSGLLMRAIWRIQGVELGFRTENLMTMRTALPLPKYGPTAPRVDFYRRVLDGVRALPGVQNAAYTTGLPMVRTGGIWEVEIDGAPDAEHAEKAASLRYVTPGYFSTIGIPLRRGRDVADSDTGDRPFVAVVSESLAKRHWPDQDPIGRRFKFALSERTVVGVVGDVRVRGREQTSEPQVYLPAGQVADNSIIGYIPGDLVIRATLPPDQWLSSVRRIIASIDPEQPISNVRPLTEIVADDIAPRRVQLRLLTVLAAVALLIAGVGLHGVLSFAVSQRTKEIGIRSALGAQAGTIVRMVLREGLTLALLGALIGVILALFVGRAMSALLFGVAAHDPETFAAAVALCLVTAIIGCLRPAIRAARVDPITALRES